ncbi:MAG: hypothetical protein ACEQR5_05195 [Moraxellaceae bacterium]
MSEIETIQEIKTLRISIREKIKNLTEYSKENFGSEQEYTHKGIIGGIEALLIDLSTLTKAKNKFVQISSYNERKDIVRYLTSILDNIDYPEYLIKNFEDLKILLRNFGVRNFSERQLEFDEECQNVLKLKIQFEEELKEVRKIKSKIVVEEKKVKENSDNYELNSTKIINEIEEVILQKTKLINETSKLQTVLNSSTELESNIKEQARLVNESSLNVQSNEKLIDSFASKVQDKDNRLLELEEEIIKQKEKVINYENERSKILKDANELIESAKLALNYKTAEGISASFKTRFDEASETKRYGWWIFGSLVCISVAISLGIWVTNSETETKFILGRISLIPLPIIGAIFCAKQYTKQKNLIEDYAYKMVLAKAIVGFSEQLKKNGSGDNSEYVHYIKTSLEEIHKDPLRKREIEKNTKDLSLDSIIDMAEKLKKVIKTEN